MTDIEISLTEPMDAYLASPELSSHRLGDFASGGPRYYAMRHITGSSVTEPRSDALVFGQVFEDLVQGVTPTLDHLAVQPADLHRGEGARARAAAWKAANAHRTVVTQDELDDLRAMHTSLAESDRARSLIGECAAQVTMRIQGELKSRPDWACMHESDEVGAPFSLDLKTCQSVDAIASGVAVREYRYHVQAALVRHLMRAATGRDDTQHYLLAVEKRSPYRTLLVRLTDEWMDIGWEWAQRQIASIRACEAAGEWPRVLQEEVEIAPPPAWLRTA